MSVPGRRVVEVTHLAKRFFGSLSDDRPSSVDDQWVRSHLLPGEEDLWGQMTAPDQRHAVQVARDVDTALPGAERDVIAAAVLHDVGKLVSGYGTFARAFATLFWAISPSRFAAKWVDRSGSIGRLAQYRLHPELGRDLLIAAGSDELTSTWAAEHHTPPDRWTIDPAVAAVLKECDND